MAGHSKWSKIKRQKGKNDAARGNVFAKMGREITVAVREGGSGESEHNFRLRLAIQKAKAAGVPNDNIDRAIQKGLGGSGTDDNFESIQYEGYGPGGVAVLIDTLTDNRNRTAGDIRSYFNKAGGNLGENGCVNWMFHKKGVIHLEPSGDPDEAMMAALEAGAEDFSDESEYFEVLSTPEDLQAVSEVLGDGYEIISAEVSYIPENTMLVEDPAAVKALLKMLDKLEEHDDVLDVHTNMDLPEALA